MKMNKIFYFVFLIVSASVQAGNWNEGGTLHKASALEWQKASYSNKLATSADMIANLWIKDMWVFRIISG